MTDSEFLEVCRGQIAIKDIRKRDIAKVLDILPGELSLYLHGEKTIKYELRQQLIEELGIAKVLEKLASGQSSIEALCDDFSEQNGFL